MPANVRTGKATVAIRITIATANTGVITNRTIAIVSTLITTAPGRESTSIITAAITAVTMAATTVDPLISSDTGTTPEYK